MQYFYSPSKNAFYVDYLQERYQAKGNWPADLQKVETEKYLQLISPPEGMMLTSDVAGKPTFAPVPQAESTEEPGAVKSDE